jgi:hypothetical protein
MHYFLFFPFQPTCNFSSRSNQDSGRGDVTVDARDVTVKREAVTGGVTDRFSRNSGDVTDVTVNLSTHDFFVFFWGDGYKIWFQAGVTEV